jgi:hypothetical protein
LADCRQGRIPSGPGDSVPGPLVRRPLGRHSGPDRLRGAAATVTGIPGRARPVSSQQHPGGVVWAGSCSRPVGPRDVQVRPVQRPGWGPRVAAPVAHRTLPARGLLTRPVAATPRIGRSAGRWLQSQSESGCRVHGPDIDHGRRPKSGQCPGLRVTGHACPSRASLAGNGGRAGHGTVRTPAYGVNLSFQTLPRLFAR